MYSVYTQLYISTVVYRQNILHYIILLLHKGMASDQKKIENEHFLQPTFSPYSHSFLAIFLNPNLISNYAVYPQILQRPVRCVVTKLYNVTYSVYTQLYISIVICIYMYTQITL